MANKEKWHIVREQKIIMKRDIEFKRRQATLLQKLSILINCHTALRRTFKKYNRHREARIERAKQSFVITIVKAKLRIKLNRLMPN